MWSRITLRYLITVGKIAFLTWQLGSGNILTVSATTDEFSGSEPETLLSTQTSTLAFSSYASNNVEIMPKVFVLF